jgi:hypothetical protein
VAGKSVQVWDNYGLRITRDAPPLTTISRLVLHDGTTEHGECRG